METVWTAAKNMEIEIDFSWGKLFHFGYIVSRMPATDKLILALDLDQATDALNLVRGLKPYLSFFKVGSQLFTREGPELLRALRAENVDLFLDLKWHDIPQTVAHAVTAAVQHEVRFVTLHAGGGLAMMQAAQAAAKNSRTQILAVTVLTSLDDSALHEIGFPRTTNEQVIHFARLAVKAGIHGLVCSPHEIELIRREIQEPLILVTPGVRSSSEATQDQKRTLSAPEAFKRGANHLVIGRPITQAADPIAAARSIIADCSL